MKLINSEELNAVSGGISDGFPDMISNIDPEFSVETKCCGKCDPQPVPELVQSLFSKIRDILNSMRIQ